MMTLHPYNAGTGAIRRAIAGGQPAALPNHDTSSATTLIVIRHPLRCYAEETGFTWGNSGGRTLHTRRERLN